MVLLNNATLEGYLLWEGCQSNCVFSLEAPAIKYSLTSSSQQCESMLVECELDFMQQVVCVS